MKKISVASLPTRFDPVANESRKDERVVACLGLTAKLHSRNGGLQDEKQVTRVRKESLMPPIPSARSSPSFRKTSTSRGQDGLHPNTPLEDERDQNNVQNGLTVFGETGYLPLNSRKKSTADKLSDTGFQLYTLDDSNKLPKILKPKRKVSKGSKRKKMNEQSDSNKHSHDDNMKPRLEAIEEIKGTSKDPSAGEDDSEDLYNKYGLDLRKDFNMEMTRPFTYSYFPNIINKKKRNGNKEAEKKKLRKISNVEMKTSLS